MRPNEVSQTPSKETPAAVFGTASSSGGAATRNRERAASVSGFMVVRWLGDLVCASRRADYRLFPAFVKNSPLASRLIATLPNVAPFCTDASAALRPSVSG